jgi:hypothetical protein
MTCHISKSTHSERAHSYGLSFIVMMEAPHLGRSDHLATLTSMELLHDRSTFRGACYEGLYRASGIKGKIALPLEYWDVALRAARAGPQIYPGGRDTLVV